MANADAVRQQLQIWERLMHMNVKIHASLRSLNQFPRGEDAQKLLDELEPETKEKYNNVRKNIFKTIELLTDLESELMEKTNTQAKEEDDEEIESSASEAEDNEELEDEDDFDADADINDVNEVEEENELKSKRSTKIKKNTLNFLEARLKSNEKSYEKNRNAILEKWFERTRLTINKKNKDNFDALESSAVSQIQKILSDRSRLIRRTQLKRVNVDRIGSQPDLTHDPEIFDDDDFYQTLLKEFIDQKSSETSDPIQISRQWLEVQKLRQQRSKKKLVDKRATKGRKIRFVPIPKLANFHPAQPEVIEWSHERRNELFKSLFRY